MAAPKSKAKRNYSDLEKKGELKKYAGKHPGAGVRELGEVLWKDSSWPSTKEQGEFAVNV